MVKVVESATELRVTCRYCSSHLEYLPKEVQVVHVLRWADNLETLSGHEYIVCPSCGVKVVLKQW